MKPLILCADDDPDILTLLVLCLGHAGYEVARAEDGDRALELARARPPVLAILDVMMPRRNGLEVLGALRTDPDLSQTKVLLLSARVQQADVARGLEAGADAYLAKPFRAADLLDAVERLLA